MQIKVPKIEIPEIKVPKIKIPEIKFARIEIPQIKLPQIEVPEIKMPKISVSFNGPDFSVFGLLFDNFQTAFSENFRLAKGNVFKAQVTTQGLFSDIVKKYQETDYYLDQKLFTWTNDFYSGLKYVARNLKEAPKIAKETIDKKLTSETKEETKTAQENLPNDSKIAALEQQVKELRDLKERGYLVKEVIKEIEVSRVVKVEPIREILQEKVITQVDMGALAKVRADIIELQGEVVKRLYAPGGVISQQIYVKEPVASPKIYQENADIVLQTVGTGNVILSAGTGAQISGKQVIIDSTDTNTPLIYLADKTRINGDAEISGNLYLTNVLSGTWKGGSIGTTYGGIGLTAYTSGDMLFATSTNILAALGIGSDGQVLTVSGGKPTWQAATGGGSTSTEWIVVNKYMYSTTTVDYISIGTSTPSSLFEVYNDSTSTNSQLTVTVGTSTTDYNPQIAFRTGVSPTTRFLMGVDYSDSNNFKIATSTFGTNDLMTIDSNTGNISFGTTSTSTLFAIATSTSIFSINTAGQAAFGTSTPSGLFTVGTTSNIFTVTKAGKVGIGTPSPSAALTISGVNMDVLVLGGSASEGGDISVYEDASGNKSLAFDADKSKITLNRVANNDWEAILENPAGGNASLGFVKTVDQPPTITGVILIVPTSEDSADGDYDLVWNNTNKTLSWGGGTAVTISTTVNDSYELPDSDTVNPGKIIAVVEDVADLPTSGDITDSNLTVATNQAQEGFVGAGNYMVFHNGSAIFNNKLYITTDNPPPPNGTNPQIWFTEDGITWSQASTTAGNSAESFCVAHVFNGSLYVADCEGSNGQFGARIYKSTDGYYFELVHDPYAVDHNKCESINSMAIFNGYLYAGGSTNNGTANCSTVGDSEVWRTRDGSTWERVISNAFGNTNNNIIRDMFVFKGYLYAFVRNTTDGTQVWRSQNGADWTQVNTNGFGLGVTGGYPSPTIFNGQLFISVSTPSVKMILKTEDGTNWVKAATGAASTALTVYNGYLYGAGGNPTNVYRSKDGNIWTQINTAGFGDTNNTDILEMDVFKGYLYAYTYNYSSGSMQIHRLQTGLLDISTGSIFTQGAQFGNIIISGSQVSGLDNLTTNEISTGALGVSGAADIGGDLLLGGKLGIGTTTAAQMLTITATSSNNAFGIYASSSAASPVFLVNNAGFVNIGTSTFSGIINIATSSQIFTINQAGNTVINNTLSIGTTTASSTYAIYVATTTDTIFAVDNKQGGVGIGTAPTNATLLNISGARQPSTTNSSVVGISLFPMVTPSASSTVTHSGMSGYMSYAGKGFGANSKVSGLTFGTYGGTMTNSGTEQLSTVGIDVFGTMAVLSNVSLKNVIGARVQGIGNGASSNFTIRDYSSALYILNDVTTETVTNPAQYGIFAEKPTVAVNNYQIGLQGTSTGSGIWFGLEAPGSTTVPYSRIYASDNRALDFDINGTTTLYLNTNGVSVGTTTTNTNLFTVGTTTNNFNITSWGSVNINTTTATSNIYIWGDGAHNASMEIGTPASNSAYDPSYVLWSGPTYYSMGIDNSDGNRFRIQSSSVIGAGSASQMLTGAGISVAISTSTTNGLFMVATSMEAFIVANSGNIAIGTTTTSNILTVRQNSPTDPVADAWTQYSSVRWKENIISIQNAMEKIDLLNPVYFDWKTGFGQGRDFGFIAEEIGKVVPEVVEWEEDGQYAKSVDYARLSALSIAGIKELKQEIEAIKLSVNQSGSLQNQSGEIISYVSADNTGFVDQIKDSLLKFTGSIQTAGEWAFEKIFVRTARVERLEVVDKATGEIWCTWIENGEWVKIRGECDQVDFNNQNINPEPAEPPPTPIEPVPEPIPADNPATSSPEESVADNPNPEPVPTETQPLPEPEVQPEIQPEIQPEAQPELQPQSLLQPILDQLVFL